METERSIVWFRGKDLRVADHGPLVDAAASGEVIPLFILDPFFFEPLRARMLPHRMQYLLESLESLQKNIERKGSRLLLVRGHSVRVLPALVKKLGATRVLAHRWVEPLGRQRDETVRKALSVPFELYEGETLLPPGSVRSGAGTPYSVYTPFARRHRSELSVPLPLKAPTLQPLPAVAERLKSEELPTLEEVGLKRNPRVIRGGERAARKRLTDFLDASLSGYPEMRDQLAEAGTSRLSADLKFGTLSIRTVWRALDEVPQSGARERFESQLLWREFAYSTLWDRPQLLERPLREDFVDFPWKDDEEGYLAWETGQTGYPVVDAAARQLFAEGYVHNRARMISASFLTRHLRVDYRRGEAHYLRYLVDGDWAQNNLGWQWAAGCGTDAQPYFRVFNPVTQGKRFDPEGSYVRRYVPELKELSRKYIHEPWKAPPAELNRAGIKLGRDYPLPCLDLKEGRTEYLRVATAHLKRA